MSDRATPAEGPAVAGAREGKETTWLFLRTLVALLAVATLVAALFVPPNPLPFLVVAAVLWLVATVAAWWLVFQGGYARLRGSRWYAPGLSATRALAVFLGLTAALKFGGTLALDGVLRGLPQYVDVAPRQDVPAGKTEVSDRPLGYDFAVSLVALVGAYLLVYRGAVAWLLGEDA